MARLLQSRTCFATLQGCSSGFPGGRICFGWTCHVFLLTWWQMDRFDGNSNYFSFESMMVFQGNSRVFHFLPINVRISPFTMLSHQACLSNLAGIAWNSITGFEANWPLAAHLVTLALMPLYGTCTFPTDHSFCSANWQCTGCFPPSKLYICLCILSKWSWRLAATPGMML